MQEAGSTGSGYPSLERPGESGPQAKGVENKRCPGRWVAGPPPGLAPALEMIHCRWPTLGGGTVCPAGEGPARRSQEGEALDRLRGLLAFVAVVLREGGQRELLSVTPGGPGIVKPGLQAGLGGRTAKGGRRAQLGRCPLLGCGGGGKHLPPRTFTRRQQLCRFAQTPPGAPSGPSLMRCQKGETWDLAGLQCSPARGRRPEYP